MTQDNNTPLTISCAEFQEKLPELFASGTNGIPDDPALQAHLDACDNCAALVRDLQYIADQARMLLEPDEEDPSPDVWINIQSKLHSDYAESEGHLILPKFQIE